MRLKHVGFALSALLFITISCEQAAEEAPKSKAQQVVDNAIAYHGLKPMDNAELEFKFRDMTYTYSRNDGMYMYTRTQTDSTGAIVVDEMNNDGLIRYIDGEVAEITEERRAAYTRSVNSVIYFLLLPYNLNDTAVIKEYNGEIEMKGKKYHELRITFQLEGGGEDYSDIFLYWFDAEDYSMDYMAYLYYTDGGGLRFREAINPRRVEGVLIQDYINMKPEDEGMDIMDIDELFVAGELKELSRIIQENVEIVIK